MYRHAWAVYIWVWGTNSTVLEGKLQKAVQNYVMKQKIEIKLFSFSENVLTNQIFLQLPNRLFCIHTLV